MSVQVTNIRVDASLNPGSGEKADLINVQVSCRFALANGDANVHISIPLPSGTIVQDVKEAERSAYEQAAEILTQLADAARKEALL